VHRSPVLAALAVVLLSPVWLTAQEVAVAERSPQKALLLSIGHTAVATSVGAALMSRGAESDLYAIPGYWLFAYGTMLAPSAGNFYGRDRERVNRGLLIRAAGTGVLVTSLWRQVFSPAFDIDDPDARRFHWDAGTAAGTGIIAAGAVYSIATAPASAEAYNRRGLTRTPPTVGLSPAAPSGVPAVALHVQLRF
jgi:hypothetical protein